MAIYLTVKIFRYKLKHDSIYSSYSTNIKYCKDSQNLFIKHMNANNSVLKSRAVMS